MVIHTHHAFDKAVAKLTTRLQEIVKRRLDLFEQEPYAPTLNNHKLVGNRLSYRSINITGDVRAIYFPVDRENALFVEIDTHHELFGS